MRDPHVVSLRYRLQTDESTSYTNPPPVEHDTTTFSLRLAENVLCIQMKAHFSSTELARSAVEGFLHAWELDAALNFGPGALRFVYEDASVIDRNPPPPGTREVVAAKGVAIGMSAASAKLHVARATYPSPSTRFRVSPDVETLWQRYQGYRKGREPLLSMAYFCLSLIESKAGGRSAAAAQFAVDEKVLRKLGEITSNRGDGATARKLNRKSTVQPLSTSEIAWIKATVTAIIRRVAEADPSDPLPLLRMADLPRI
jgi:hypothetical protein